MLGNLFRHALDDLHIGGDQIIPAHTWLARQAGGDDDDIRAGNILVVTGASDL